MIDAMDAKVVPDDLTLFARQTVAAARNAVFETAASLSVEPRELACTFILVLTDARRLCVAQIGDGAVVSLYGDIARLISAPGESEHPRHRRRSIRFGHQRFQGDRPSDGGVTLSG